MPTYELKPHPDHHGSAVRSITVDARRGAGGVLRLDYLVRGAIDAVRWPEPARHEFADLLWQHSCFEAFVGARGDKGYREYNLSPSSQFATYAFDDHRDGMRNAADAIVVEQHFSRTAEEARMRALVQLEGLADAPCWEIGLTTVIEELSGAKSLWALAHPDGPPDFHARDCFVARLAAPDAS
ncbi:MAG TPA: DOMON-like domain-containing protein [Sphingomonas sp.]|nr:DOMON-like domain-containing protein [Sphingomonas sp.]